MACRAGWKEISPTGDTERKVDMSFKIKKVRPLFTSVVTTARTYVGDQHAKVGGVIIDTRKMDGSLNPFQTVVSVGTKRYEIVEHVPGAIDEQQNKQATSMAKNVEVPMIVIDDQQYLYLQINDIEYVVTEYEVDEGGLLQ